MLVTVNNYSRTIKLTSTSEGLKQLKLQRLDFNTSPRLSSTKKEKPLNLKLQQVNWNLMR